MPLTGYIYIMMKISLPAPTVRKLCQTWGKNKTAWERYLSAILGTDIRLPQFFWEIRLNIRPGKKIYELTLELPLFNAWMAVAYAGSLQEELRRRTMRSVMTDSFQISAADPESRDRHNNSLG